LEEALEAPRTGAAERAGPAFERLVDVMARLRAPGGCPWDAEQTHRSLAVHLLEEAYEALDAIDSGSMPDLEEELGDLLLQVVFHAEIAAESGHFEVGDVIDGLVRKLVDRHPHVFGEVKAENADQALASWAKLKAEEKAERGKKGALHGIPRSAPALIRAFRTGEKAAAVGFDWPDVAGPIAKVREELGELSEAMEDGAPTRIEHELGDLLFAVANLGRWLKVHPEEALRGTLRRFESRFHYIEERLQERSKSPRDSTLAEMDALWNEAKREEVGG
jgi:MazG family protein